MYARPDLISQPKLKAEPEALTDEMVFIVTGLGPNVRIQDLECTNIAEFYETIRKEAARMQELQPHRLALLDREGNYQNAPSLAVHLGLDIQCIHPDRRHLVESLEPESEPHMSGDELEEALDRLVDEEAVLQSHDLPDARMEPHPLPAFAPVPAELNTVPRGRVCFPKPGPGRPSKSEPVCSSGQSLVYRVMARAVG